jgi:hypothetical protein
MLTSVLVVVYLIVFCICPDHIIRSMAIGSAISANALCAYVIIDITIHITIQWQYHRCKYESCTQSGHGIGGCNVRVWCKSVDGTLLLLGWSNYRINTGINCVQVCDAVVECWMFTLFSDYSWPNQINVCMLMHKLAGICSHTLIVVHIQPYSNMYTKHLSFHRTLSKQY